MRTINEFNLINMVDKLYDFKLITKNQRDKIIEKNRQRRDRRTK